MTKIEKNFRNLITTASFCLFLGSKKPNRAGYSVVHARICVKGEKVQFSTGILVPANRFKHGRIIHNGESDLINYQTQLNLIISNLVQVETDLRIKGHEITPQRIALALKSNIAPCFLDCANEWLAEQEKLVGMDLIFKTLQKKRWMVRHVRDFIVNELKNPKIALAEIKTNFAERLVLYLRGDRKYVRDYAKRVVELVKRILNYAVIKEYIGNNALLPFRVPAGKKKPIEFLTIEQIRKIKNLNFDNLFLERIRDLYLLQIYTGLAYVDLSNLSTQHIHLDANKQLWIKIPRQKTATTSVIPVVNEARSILNKYLENPVLEVGIQNKGFLPVPCNQVYNRELKKIGLFAQIDRKIMVSHTARRTFCTTILNSGTISIETISSMMGHTSVTITEKYYGKVGQAKIGAEMAGFKFLEN
ncbi:MAG: tyrosine-type recombinase/integrase [Bacteroidota bacterium]